MAKPVLDQINVVCGDYKASIAFYRRLGVDIPDAAIWRTQTGAHHANAIHSPASQPARLELDSAAFARRWNDGWKSRDDLKGRVVIGFRVPERADVDEIFRNMTDAGYRGLQEPVDAFWGARYAIIEDPDGIAIGVMSPVSADRKSAPPDV